MRTAVITIGDKDDDGYPVSLSLDDDGAAWDPRLVEESRITMPDSMPQLLGAPLTFDLARRLVLTQKEESPEFQVVGHFLHELLAGGPAGVEWNRLRTEARQSGKEIRTLLDVRDDALRRMPWELLWDRQRPVGAFAEAELPCARVRAFRGDRQAPEDWWPLLRVMVIVALKEDDAATELAGLFDGFAKVCGLVDLDVVRRPSEQQLRLRYEALKPHVLHFIGHGEPGKLIFPAPDGEDDDWTWDAGSIDTVLKQPKPRLAVLNACRSAELTHQTGVWDLSDTLTAAGIPAVIAMQGDVNERAAAAFSVELYRQLGAGAPVDAAVAAGRYAMKSEPGGSWARRDPWLPSLTIAVPPEQVLPRLYPLPVARRVALAKTPGYEVVHQFVDRGKQRRQLWRAIVDVADDGRPEGIAITGETRTGKTALAMWAVGACGMRGHDAAYVDLERRTLNSLGLLATIAEELCRGSGDAPHVVDALDAYVAEVDALQHEPPPAAPLQPTEGRYRRKHADVSDSVIASIYTAFRGALSTIAGDGRVLIALDNLQVTQDGHWGTYSVPHLLGRLAEAKTICVVTAANKRELEGLLGGALAKRFTPVEVPHLEKTELRDLLGQLMRANRYQRPDFGPFLVKYVDVVPAKPTAKYLETALSIAVDQGWEQDPP